MKVKDIEVGQEYAIGAPGRHYGFWHSTLRVRVTRLRVHGAVFNTWHYNLSSRANFVEFELVDDHGRVSSQYEHRIVEDPEHGERVPTRGNETLKVHRKLRCMTSHVLMPWAQFEAERAAHEEHETKAEAAKEVRERKYVEMRERFEKLGFKVPARYTEGTLSFSTKDAMQILLALEAMNEDNQA